MTDRILCKFTHDTSLVAEGERFWIVGTETNEWFAPSGSDQAVDPIVGAVNLVEGLVHILTERGSMYEVRASTSTTFTITKIRDWYRR